MERGIEMEIIGIEVDELPMSCKDCTFSGCNCSHNSGICVAMDYAEISTIPGCVHRDCPLFVCGQKKSATNELGGTND